MYPRMSFICEPFRSIARNRHPSAKASTHTQQQQQQHTDRHKHTPKSFSINFRHNGEALQYVLICILCIFSSYGRVRWLATSLLLFFAPFLMLFLFIVLLLVIRCPEQVAQTFDCVCIYVDIWVRLALSSILWLIQSELKCAEKLYILHIWFASWCWHECFVFIPHSMSSFGLTICLGIFILVRYRRDISWCWHHPTE